MCQRNWIQTMDDCNCIFFHINSFLLFSQTPTEFLFFFFDMLATNKNWFCLRKTKQEKKNSIKLCSRCSYRTTVGCCCFYVCRNEKGIKTYTDKILNQFRIRDIRKILWIVWLLLLFAWNEWFELAERAKKKNLSVVKLLRLTWLTFIQDGPTLSFRFVLIKQSICQTW